jgi:hypothetical protein
VTWKLKARWQPACFIYPPPPVLSCRFFGDVWGTWRWCSWNPTLCIHYRPVNKQMSCLIVGFTFSVFYVGRQYVVTHALQIIYLTPTYILLLLFFFFIYMHGPYSRKNFKFFIIIISFLLLIKNVYFIKKKIWNANTLFENLECPNYGKA